MCFEVKMNVRRKARYVANVVKTTDLSSTTYAGVVSRKSVRITLTFAALKELQVMSSDIQLQAPISGKYWTICEPEFDPDLEGCKANIIRVLYGTKYAG